MKTIRVTAAVDQDHRLIAHVPDIVSPGTIEIELQVPSTTDDESSDEWMRGIAREWAADLADERQDICTTNDGECPKCAPC